MSSDISPPSISELSSFISEISPDRLFSLRLMKFVDSPADYFIQSPNKQIPLFFGSKINSSPYSILPPSNTIFSPSPLPISDWSAFYFQISLAHAMTYITQKFETSNKITLIEGKINPKAIEARNSSNSSSILPFPPVYEIRHPFFLNSSIAGKIKADLLKLYFSIPIQNPLMNSFPGSLLLLDNSHSHYEWIFPHSFIIEKNNSWFQWKILMEFEGNSGFETLKWRKININNINNNNKNNLNEEEEKMKNKNNSNENSEELNENNENSIHNFNSQFDWHFTNFDEKLNTEKFLINPIFMNAIEEQQMKEFQNIILDE